MQCPECDGKTKVIDSRFRDFMYRRRRCTSCSDVFTTYEFTQLDVIELLEDVLTDDQLYKINTKLDSMYGKSSRKMSIDPTEIIEKYSSGVNLNELAIAYGCSLNTIYRRMREVRN